MLSINFLGNVVSLEQSGRLGNCFAVSCKNSASQSGILCEQYKQVRKKAQELATQHPDWPKDSQPSNNVIFDGNTGEFLIKPKEV